jgi:phage shock protein PspC (stress-responsive transcriptional regulator)
MKKVININFQGRVIPIEEPAYEELRNYTESLRRHFAQEEGRDEIINDIENRIAERFTDHLRNTGAGCITEADLEQVIQSIGRPEDFDRDENNTEPGPAGGATSGRFATGPEPRGSMYRNSRDRVLGGVCSGLAHYLRIDPTLVRVLFALVTLGGFGTGFLIYIVLWIVVPERELTANIRRRLYRNPEQKILGGVGTGLAAYFNIAVWIPRVVFLSPILFGALSGILSDSWLPEIISIPFGGSLFLAYIILWIIVPEAITASEKLEMRGEKVDLDSIRTTIQEELGSLKGKARKAAPEIQDRMENWGQEVKQSAENLSTRVGPAAHRAGSGIAHAIRVLFKVFFLFIGGIFAFALLMTAIGILVAFAALLPLKGFFLQGPWENLAVGGTLLLFLAIPPIAIVIWLVRRIAGIRSRRHYLGWIFAGLWALGWVSLFYLVSMKGNDFSRPGEIENTIPLRQPSGSRMRVELGPTPGKFYPLQWVNDGDDELPLLNRNEDSLLLNTVRIRIAQSPDSLFHLRVIRRARAANVPTAEEIAEGIAFPISQEDSILRLPKGFAIAKQVGFHNQQVILDLQVPVGKSIYIDEEAEYFGYFDMSGDPDGIHSRNRRNYEAGDEFYHPGIWYIMQPDGLERMFKTPKSREGREGREGLRGRIDMQFEDNL